MNIFNVMNISNASIIFLFNILYAFAFIKSMYFECQNKQFEEEEKTRLATSRLTGR